ncbi:hypothetical protein BOX15_Mlig008546g1 [Macrostomum lignano]|uniref:Protein kinase domain-containing protein n=1 Tax=Macrostomum lignano TaxID=282301 RepID=A0A267ELU7_9PLAT|nr:hypothetical protein BOX15_Mlig008546g1 [Macrostomum lignano]
MRNRMRTRTLIRTIWTATARWPTPPATAPRVRGAPAASRCAARHPDKRTGPHAANPGRPERPRRRRCRPAGRGANPNLAEPLHALDAASNGGAHRRRRGCECPPGRPADRRQLADRRRHRSGQGGRGWQRCLGDALAVGRGRRRQSRRGGRHTPLMWAAQSGHAGAIERLLSRGARRSARTRPASRHPAGRLQRPCRGSGAAAEALGKQRREAAGGQRRHAGRGWRRRQAAGAGRGSAHSQPDGDGSGRSGGEPEQQSGWRSGLAKVGPLCQTAAEFPLSPPAAPPVVSGTMTRLISSQTVLPHGFLQSLDIRRDTLRYLSQGHFGCVYQAQRADGHYVVLKVVSAPFRPNQPDQASSVSEANRREVELMQAMRHRNIVQFYTAQLVPGSLVICMEYIHGENLRLYRQRLGSLAESLIVNYLSQICHGLNYVHSQNVCHRDVKCENIMLQLSTGLVKIIDFGLSKKIHATEVYHSGVGTLLWMAPEVLLFAEDPTRRRRRYDPKAADVYSLGCSLHELCTGVPPLYSEEGPGFLKCLYHAKRTDEPLPEDALLRCGMSQSLRSFYAACVAKNPLARPTLPQLLAHPLIVGAAY